MSLNPAEKTVLIILIALLFALAGVRHLQNASRRADVSVVHSEER